MGSEKSLQHQITASVDREFWRTNISACWHVLQAQGWSQTALDWVLEDLLRRLETLRLNPKEVSVPAECAAQLRELFELANEVNSDLVRELCGALTKILIDVELQLYQAKFGSAAARGRRGPVLFSDKE
jgi:hypothetical protein